ncbi:hypothetical protein ACOMHN_026615 [Nucella lapillus]
MSQMREMLTRMDIKLDKTQEEMKDMKASMDSLNESFSGLKEEKEEHKKHRPRGSVHLAAAVVSPSDEDSQTFTVTAANGEAFKLRASDARERQHWVDRLRATAEYHTANIGFSQQQQPGSQSQSRRDSGGNVAPRDGTPKHLEASQRHKGQYSSEESVHSTPGRKQTPVSRGETPTPFLEVQEYLTEAHDYSQKLSEKIATLPYSGDNCFMTGLDKDLLMLKATSGATLTCVQQCLSLLQNNQISYPGVSHSSSMPIQTSSRKPPPISPSLPADLTLNQSCVSATSPAESFTSAKSVPYAFHDLAAGEGAIINHEEEEEDDSMYHDSELGAVEEHKSIILHLLSQLKLGMDLTKVVLPTFILERRSLLELFADCMAHPDIFLRIPDIQSPEQRMLMVMEWYLTSFHAGRQGSVAKKPYNPIIGETFHCSWQIPQETVLGEGPDGSSGGNDSNGYPEGNERLLQLVYCAEQVSHHPPVSAFYFECPEKKVCMNASIWTKSKFMGMSIGVVMVGKLSLRLLEHDEEYVFGLPSAYARSILTVPWVELGDKITLSCEKTNLTASIVFHTKPFYGGKLHRVSAEMKNYVSGASLCKVAGEWNGCYEFTYADGSTKVIDTQQLRVWHKRVRPVKKQGEFESRRLWQHVTNALNIGDVNTATEHKRFLEERQREGERHRKESGAKFPTKFFQEEGETWVFNKLLAASPSADKAKPAAV